MGKRYQEEKKEEGRPKGSLFAHKLANSLPVNGQIVEPSADRSTAGWVAEQSNVSHQTVKNAEKYAKAVDSVSEIPKKYNTR